jgi:elongation factor P
MIGINDLKNGTVFEHDGHPWLVLEYNHSKMGRGGAVLKTKIKNLISGAIVQKTFQGSDKFEEVKLERKTAQYLYKDDSGYVFMDEQTFEQFNLGPGVIGDSARYTKEGESVELHYYKEKPISLNIPIKVALRVTEAEFADKGNTATGATKPITLETGTVINGPLFIKPGDSVVVDTRTGTYVERA